MILYRLESNNKRSDISENVMAGPYCGGSSGIAEVALPWHVSSNKDTHPGPHQDARLIPFWNKLRGTITTRNSQHEYIFGFVSREQLERWFYDRERMNELHKLDIAQIGVYKVSNHWSKEGQFQAIANAFHCELIETQPVWRTV